MFRTIVPAIAAVVALAACSAGSKLQQGSRLAGEATFDPQPTDQDAIEAQLKRFPGQTKFLRPQGRFNGPILADAARSARPEGAAGGARAIQESDVFKVGKPGSKLLYLLNDYRGLQVVSFTDGADQPKLLGRVAATGNYPQDMYYDAAHDRLVVLENNYQSEENDAYAYSDSQSRLVVYDVANPTAPKIAATFDLKGGLAESRMVGSVLYAATSVRPSYYDRQTSPNGKGYVYSFGLDVADVHAVDTAELAAPVGYGQAMNVVEVKAGDQMKYYVVAVLSKDGWGFWDRQSLVEVVDISSPAGKIAPLMVVNAKGVVRERSQTTIKNDTLVVTSNYTLGEGTTAVARVAVETFTFPTAQSEVITTDEAQFRKLYVDRAVAKKETELKAQGVSGDALTNQLDAYKAQLLAAVDLGLQGRFVKQTSDAGVATLVKQLPDSVVTVGNTQGLSASLQDVRYADGLLYAFWVPANNIDPLDVFDLSAPEKGVKHLGHLEFDGWIQRAFPVTYNNKNYILGLGWIIPSDDEHQRRYPQAALFEVKQFATGAVHAEVVAQKNIGSSDTWINFNAQDKEIETRFTSDGAGVILFAFDSWANSTYLSGGKLIGFDIKQADINPDAVFTEGAVLAGSSDWLKRVFTNTEIDRVNTFADTALGVFDVSSGLGAAGAVAKATATLELARDVRSYETLGAVAALHGVQVVSHDDWTGGGSTTDLRLVDAAKADAEKGAAASVVSLPGSYLDLVKLDDATLLVLTESYKRVPATTGHGFDYKSSYVVSRVALATNGLAVTGSSTWDATFDAQGPRLGWQQKLVKTAGGKVLVTGGGTVKALALGTDVQATNVSLSGCDLTGSQSAALLQLDASLYLTYSVPVADATRANVSYLRDFVAPLALGTGSLACAAAVNVPGTPIAMTAGHVVTNDTRLIDIVKRGTADSVYFDVVTDTDLASLKLVGGQATLVDLYDPKNVDATSMKIVGGDTLVFVESTARSNYWLSERARIGRFNDFFPSEPTESRLTMVGFSPDLQFTKKAWVIDLPGSTNASLQALVPSPKAGEGYLAVVAQSQTVSVFAVNGTDRPVAKQLQAVDAQGVKLPPANSVTLNGFWYWYGQSLHFTPSLGSFELPQGLFGVQQVYVVE